MKYMLGIICWEVYVGKYLLGGICWEVFVRKYMLGSIFWEVYVGKYMLFDTVCIFRIYIYTDLVAYILLVVIFRSISQIITSLLIFPASILSKIH